MRNPRQPDTGLTVRQQETWRFLAQHLQEHQHQASVQDICDRFQLASSNAVHGHLRVLESRGLLHLGAGRARSMQLVGVRLELIPLDSPVGQVARCLLAGVPPPAPPTPEQKERVLCAAVGLVHAIDADGEIPALLAELENAVHALEGGER